VKTLAVRAFLVTAAIAIVVTACGPARPAGGPYPDACVQWGYSARRCEAIVDRGLETAGLDGVDVESVELRPFEPKATLGGIQVALIGFTTAGGGVTEVEVWCIGIDSGKVCDEDASIGVSGGVDRDVPCPGEPPAGCATLPPTPDPDAVAAAAALHVASLSIAIDHLGAYEVEVGAATLPDGYLSERSAALADAQPEAYWIEAGVRIDVRPTIAGRPPVGSRYRDPFDGPEPVTVFLVFTVTELDRAGTLEIRDLLVR